MYILLTGTRKNAGDFLIAHSAGRLFEKFAPDPRFVELPAWQRLDEHLETVNSANALILCGGPAFQPGIGRRIYPILPILDRIKIPIISFGLGWKGIPGDDYDLEHYWFPSYTKPLFDRLQNDFKYVGCRDELTCRILAKYGVDNAFMTGCPAWYDPDYFDKDLVIPSQISQVLFTPAEQPVFSEQSTAVMQTVRELFPDQRIVCSFHRGWTTDQYTPSKNAENAFRLKAEAEKLGMQAWDVSGSVEGMLKYDRFDIHVGYRLHAHLKMLSMRKPSFLITEDGRGRAALEAMNLKGVNGWRRNLPAKCIPHPLIRKVMRKLATTRWINNHAPAQAKDLIRDQLDSNFEMFVAAVRTIDDTWQKMHRMLTSLPNTKD